MAKCPSISEKKHQKTSGFVVQHDVQQAVQRIYNKLYKSKAYEKSRTYAKIVAYSLLCDLLHKESKYWSLGLGA